jgi:ABC-type nitrate/sulfonate/bicarbonate transport system ATPase subunit
MFNAIVLIAHKQITIYLHLEVWHAHRIYVVKINDGHRRRSIQRRMKSVTPDEGALDVRTRAKLQDELLEIIARMHSTVVMVTHDVDEAVLLSDKIVMVTNVPSATNGEVLRVALADCAQ